MASAAKKIVLTDKAIQALKPAPKGKRYIVWDALVPGLGIRVNDTTDDKGNATSKTFLVVRRRPGDAYVTYAVLSQGGVSRYPGKTLKAARAEAGEALAAISDGIKPRELAEEKRREEALLRQDTVAVVAEDFIKRHVAKMRSAQATEGTIRRELLGQVRVNDEWIAGPDKKAGIGSLPITKVARRDIVELLEQIADRPAPALVHKTLSIARSFFNWAIERGKYGFEVNPCARVDPTKLAGAATIRSRVLTDAELPLIWKAAGDAGYPFGTLIRMLLLTGQRRTEIAAAQWAELSSDGLSLTIPADRMKGGDGHVVPLTTRATESIAAVPRFDKAEFIFSSTAGRRPISGFSKSKARLDEAIAKAVKEAQEKGEDIKDVAPWTLHDLRRTARTRLSSLGVLPHIAEMVIGHKQGGIHAVYDQHHYDAEKRDALDRWEAALLAIVEPKPTQPEGEGEPEPEAAEPSNVVRLRSGAKP